MILWVYHQRYYQINDNAHYEARLVDKYLKIHYIGNSQGGELEDILVS